MAETVELKKWSIRLYIIYSISADILVIGRAITQNPDPGRAAQAIADSLGMGE